MRLVGTRIRFASLSFFVLLIGLASGGALLPHEQANAAISQCGDQYSTQAGGRAKQACEVGYLEGKGDGTVCSRYTNPAENEACRFGYNTYVADKEACATNSGGEGAVRQCQIGLRPNVDPGDTGGPTTPPSSPSPVTSAKPVSNPPTSGDIKGEKNDEDTEAKECSITGFFGTLVCGATTFAAKLTDQSFRILSIFLETGPVTQTDKQGADSSMFSAWAAIRNIANVLFVIAFIVIIFSYLTNTGIDAYNIKRMIPRLIVGALLINLSFTLCALMVDISNILGKTLAETIGGLVEPSVSGGEYTTWEGVVTTAVLAGAGAVALHSAAAYGTLSMLLPVLTSALIVVITTFIILMIRQVLIILLIVISPLAFAAILLPNTSSWFDKWRKIFIPVVLLFPAISLVYGLSQVAATIVQEYAKNQGSVLLAILALGVQIVPLFLTPTLLRLGGGVLNRFGGMGSSKFANSIREKANNRAEHSKTLRDLHGLTPAVTKGDKLKRTLRDPTGLRGRATRRKADRERKNKEIDENLDTARNQDFAKALQDQDPTLASRLYNKALGRELDDGYGADGESNYTTKGDALAQQLAQSGDTSRINRARNLVIHERIKAKAKVVKARRLELVNGDTSRNDMIANAVNASGNVSALTQEAAILHIAESGDIGAILAILKKSGEHMSADQRRTLMTTLHSKGASAKMPFLANPEAMGAIERGEVTEQNFGSKVIAPSLVRDDYSANAFAEMDPDVTNEVAQEIQHQIANENSLVSKDKLREHAHAAHEALTGKDTKLKVNHNRNDLERIATATKDFDHEEALLLNRLHDMDNRSEEPW
jgi:hypothetical protein